MDWQLTDDVARYHAHADAFLCEDPIRHTALMSVVDTLRACGFPEGQRGESAWFGWWNEGERVAGTFVHTSPHPLLLGQMSRIAAMELADELTQRHVRPTGVTGDAATTPVFAAAWEQNTGALSEVTAWHRLLRLELLDWPEPMPPGAARLATRADRDLLLAWSEAFELESLGVASPSAARVDHRIGYGGLLMWEVDGVPVAMAGRTRALSGVVRIGPVYTPPEHRRRGYATALTAALSEAALAEATDVLLFTDLANPTSNAVYQRIGYRPVEDRLMIGFSYPSPPQGAG